MQNDLQRVSTLDLLRLWAGAANELARRDVIRTKNIVGDLAEAIAHKHFGGERSTFSGGGWDIRAADGELIQVKALWRASPTRRKVSAIRDKNYDSVVVIVFDPDFNLVATYKLSREAVATMFSYNQHVNGIQISVTQRFVNDPRVTTIDLTAAYETVIGSPSAVG